MPHKRQDKDRKDEDFLVCKKSNECERNNNNKIKL